jgi:membrane protein DedA with SNARE-associated domain
VGPLCGFGWVDCWARVPGDERVLFVATLGGSLPAPIALLAGGAASHHGLRFGVLLPMAFGSAMLGDMVLFFGGRYTGWWLLAGVCRISMDPERFIFEKRE